MSFKDVMGHERPINLLQRAIAQEKVVHSYLFLGNEGIGKSLVALQFAKALNCLEGENNPDGCDRCPSCKKIDHHLHPDVSLIEPEGQTLKVDQVREMQREHLSMIRVEKDLSYLLADRRAPRLPCHPARDSLSGQIFFQTLNLSGLSASFHSFKGDEKRQPLSPG